MNWRRYFRPAMQLQLLGVHAILLAYTALAMFPVLVIIVNSVKSRRAIFKDPYSIALPNSENWDLVGYETVRERGDFALYFRNSIIVTVGAVFLILFLGAMAAFALSEYQFKGNPLLALYMSIGIMIPIRLGTVSIIRLNSTLSSAVKNVAEFLGLSRGEVDSVLVGWTLLGLILVYTAAGLPLAIFILTNFMKQVPRDLKDAARVDGASEYRIFGMVLPLVRPALGTVAVFNMIPVWNDLWFPLVLANSERTKTVTLGAQTFLGQFVNDWNAVLASLTLSMLPVLILYIIFSRQLIRGLTAGAVK